MWGLQVKFFLIHVETLVAFQVDMHYISSIKK